MCGTPERRYNLCKLTRQRLSKHFSESYGSLASEKLSKQLGHHFNRGAVEFEQFCALCEDLGACFEDEFSQLRKLAFSLLDADGDDYLCDFDVIEFDKIYILERDIFPQCRSDVSTLIESLNRIAKSKGHKEAAELKRIFQDAGLEKVNGITVAIVGNAGEK